MALIDVEYFKRLPLGINERAMPPTESLQEFIETASEQVELFCDRRFLSSQRVEEVRGTDRAELLLDEWPVTALTSVTWIDTAGTTGTVDTSLLRFSEGGVVSFKNLTDGPWYSSRLYTVTYTAGYTAESMPRPLKHAVALWTTELMRPSFGGVSTQRPPEFVPLSTEQIEDLLDNFRRRRLG